MELIKMFRIISTGKNLNYGKKGEVRFMNDFHTKCGLERGYIESTVKYLGKGDFCPEILKSKIESARRRIRIENEKINHWSKLIKKLI